MFSAAVNGGPKTGRMLPLVAPAGSFVVCVDQPALYGGALEEVPPSVKESRMLGYQATRYARLSKRPDTACLASKRIVAIGVPAGWAAARAGRWWAPCRAAPG